MKQPRIDLIPLRPAVCSDVSVTLDVLAKMTPPVVKPAAKRPMLNLELVLDRFGSFDCAKRWLKFLKRAKHQAYQRRQSKPPDL